MIFPVSIRLHPAMLKAMKAPALYLKNGSVFEDSPLGLDKWLVAMWLIANCKNGISSCEIESGAGSRAVQRSASGIAPGNEKAGFPHGSFRFRPYIALILNRINTF